MLSGEIEWIGGFGANCVVDVTTPLEQPSQHQQHLVGPLVFQTGAVPPGDEGISGRSVLATVIPVTHAAAVRALTTAGAPLDCIDLASLTLGLIAAEMSLRGERDAVIASFLSLVAAVPAALTRAVLAKLARRYLGDAGVVRAVLSLWAISSPQSQALGWGGGGGGGDPTVPHSPLNDYPTSADVRTLAAVFELGVGLVVTATGGGSAGAGTVFAATAASLGCAADASLLELLVLLLRSGAWPAVGTTLLDEIITVASMTSGPALEASRAAVEALAPACATPKPLYPSPIYPRATIAAAAQQRAWVHKILTELLIPTAAVLWVGKPQRFTTSPASSASSTPNGLSRSVKSFSGDLTTQTRSSSGGLTSMKRSTPNPGRYAEDAAAVREAVMKRVELRISGLVNVARRRLARSVLQETEMTPRALLSSTGDKSLCEAGSDDSDGTEASSGGGGWRGLAARGSPARPWASSVGVSIPRAGDSAESSPRPSIAKAESFSPSSVVTNTAAAPEFGGGGVALRVRRPTTQDSSFCRGGSKPPLLSTRMAPTLSSVPIVGSVSPRPSINKIDFVQQQQQSLVVRLSASDDSDSAWLTPPAVGSGGVAITSVVTIASGRRTASHVDHRADAAWSDSGYPAMLIRNDRADTIRELVAFLVSAVKELTSRGFGPSYLSRLSLCLGNAIDRLSPSSCADYETLLRGGLLMARADAGLAFQLVDQVLMRWPHTDCEKARALVLWCIAVFPAWWQSDAGPLGAAARSLFARLIERLCLVLRSPHGALANEAILAVLPSSGADFAVAAIAATQAGVISGGCSPNTRDVGGDSSVNAGSIGTPTGARTANTRTAPRSRIPALAVSETSLFETALLGHPRELLAVARALSENLGVRHARPAGTRPPPIRLASPRASQSPPRVVKVARKPPPLVLTKGRWAEGAFGTGGENVSISPCSALDSDNRSTFSNGSGCASVSLGSISHSSSFSSFCELTGTTPRSNGGKSPRGGSSGTVTSPRTLRNMSSPLAMSRTSSPIPTPSEPNCNLDSAPHEFAHSFATSATREREPFGPAPLSMSISTPPVETSLGGESSSSKMPSRRTRTTGRRLLLLACAALSENLRRALAAHATDKAFRRKDVPSIATPCRTPHSNPTTPSPTNASPGATPPPVSPPYLLMETSHDDSSSDTVSSLMPLPLPLLPKPQTCAHWSATIRFNSLVALSALEARARDRYPTAFGAAARSKIEAAILRSMKRWGQGVSILPLTPLS